jgi:hypothetical protein
MNFQESRNTLEENTSGATEDTIAVTKGNKHRKKVAIITSPEFRNPRNYISNKFVRFEGHKLLILCDILCQTVLAMWRHCGLHFEGE